MKQKGMNAAILAIVFGIIFLYIEPIIGILLLAVGVLVVARGFFRDKFSNIFATCGLEKNGVRPRLKSKGACDGYVNGRFEKGLESRYTIPAGLSVSDFKKQQEAIENNLDIQIRDLYSEKKCIVIKYIENK